MAIPVTFDDLGHIGGAGRYVFNTNGSGFDTELGLWDYSGNLLGSNDDGGRGLHSRIVRNLVDGDYFIGISEYNSRFRDNFLNVGTGVEPGENFIGRLNINRILAGRARVNDQLAQETAFFGFTIGATPVPEPTTLFLLGAGLAAFGFSRRK